MGMTAAAIWEILKRFWWAIPLAVLFVMQLHYKHAYLHNQRAYVAEKKARIAVQADFDNFKARVERLGQEQQERNRVTLVNQQKAADESAKSYESRLASINGAYARLRGDKSSAGLRYVPTIPDTARPTTDAASDQRLLEVLRAADENTAKLIELQTWLGTVR